MLEEHEIRSFSELIVPLEHRNDQNYWNEKWAILRELSSIAAILKERVYFFKKEFDRNDAWTLVLVADLAWQLLQELSLKRKDDLRNELKSHRGYASINRVFKLHTFLRHPTDSFPGESWMLSDPWPKEQSQELLQSARDLGQVLNYLCSFFEKNSGWASDVRRKTEMSIIAEEAQVVSKVEEQNARNRKNGEESQ